MAEYRGARPTDLDQILPLLEGFARERAALTGQTLRENFMEYAQPAMAQTLNHPVAFVVVAEAEGRMIGYAAGMTQEPPPLFDGNPYLFISDLYVVPECRRQGIGTALVERVRGWGMIKGILRASLVAPRASEPARRIAARLGFQTVEELYYWQDQP